MITSPITGSEKIKKLQDIDILKVIEGYKRRLSIDIEYLFDGITSLSLYECTKTKYRFFYPFICGDAKFYQSLQNYDWYYTQDRWDFNTATGVIKDGPLLEIGCGKGFFLNQIQQKGINCLGTEINPEAIDSCIDKGLNVSNKSFTQLSQEYKSSFKYIVSFQLLEHLFDISEFFINCRNLLKDDGKLIIAVPNNESFVFNNLDNSMYSDITLLLNLPPHHVGHWNRQNLLRVAEYFGFKKISIQYEPLYLSNVELVSGNLLKKFWPLRLFRESVLKKITKYVKKNRLKVRGNSMIIILQKEKN